MIGATIVLLVAHAIVPGLRRRSAAERHLLWSIAMAAAALMPLLGVVLPQWQPAWASRLVDAWPASLAAFRPWSSAHGADVVVRATGIEPSAWGVVEWLVLVWALGISVALIVLARDVARLVRLARDAERLVDRRCEGLCAELARQLHLSGVPALFVSRRAVMPMTWGLRRPRVLLPAGALEWPLERLRVVLAHELAHIARGDWLVHVLAQIACAIYWFHPLFRTAERALGRESEQAADDEALGVGLEASHYAAHVIEIVRSTRAIVPSRAPAVAMARAAHLERRVAALLRADANRRRVSRRTAMVTASCGTVIVLPLAVLTAAMTATAAAVDVDVRTVALPAALRVSITPGPAPMIPAVRLSQRQGDELQPEIDDYTTPPLYSDEARRRGVEGFVTIAVRVDERGRVANARVVKGLGFGLDQNALVALRQWRFHPGSRGGVPVAIDAEVDVEFNLRSEGVNELIANDMATLVGPDVTPPRVVRTSGVPLDAVNARGVVVLDVVLLQDGSPKIVRILKSLTPEADEIAVRHFDQWRFTPAMKSGVPVKVRMNAEVRFHG